MTPVSPDFAYAQRNAFNPQALPQAAPFFPHNLSTLPADTVSFGSTNNKPAPIPTTQAKPNTTKTTTKPKAATKAKASKKTSKPSAFKKIASKTTSSTKLIRDKIIKKDYKEAFKGAGTGMISYFTDPRELLEDIVTTWVISALLSLTLGTFIPGLGHGVGLVGGAVALGVAAVYKMIYRAVHGFFQPDAYAATVNRAINFFRFKKKTLPIPKIKPVKPSTPPTTQRQPA